MSIGIMRYLESPLAPSTILWINFLMDTMAGIQFGSELPDKSKERIYEIPRENTASSQIS